MPSGLSPLTLSPSTSRYLTLMLAGLQLLCLAVLVLVPISITEKLLLLLALLVQGIVSHYRLHGRSRHRPLQLHIDAEHRVRMVLAGGKVVQTRLRGDSVVTSSLLLLRFEGHGSLLLGPDSLTTDELRRLRIMLRFGSVDRP